MNPEVDMDDEPPSLVPVSGPSDSVEELDAKLDETSLSKVPITIVTGKQALLYQRILI